ncbi:MAG: hypothetical protein P8Y71_28980 [Pseudolabrys sp.]
MLKSSKRTAKPAAHPAPADCGGEPAKDAPRSAIDLEFLAIELSLARARAIIRAQPLAPPACGDKPALE